MNKLIVVVITFLMLASCVSPHVPFERMSDGEIAGYNESVTFWEQVYCTSDIRIGSHIRKRKCLTLSDLRDYNSNQIGLVNTAGTGSGVFR